MLQNITTMLQITVFVKKNCEGYENREKLSEVLQEETKGTPKPNRREIWLAVIFLCRPFDPRPCRNLHQTHQNIVPHTYIFIYSYDEWKT